MSLSTCIPEETIESVKSKLRELKNVLEEKKKEVDKAKIHLSEFLRRFPFRTDPSAIERAKPEDLYSPGKKDYFFCYIEQRLRPLGAVFSKKAKEVHRSVPWEEAANKIDIFKSLVRRLVDDSVPLHKKIDSDECEKLKYWGGDRIIIKKIVSLYYSDRIVPIFRTGMLESIVSSLNLWDCVRGAAKRFGRSYSELSVGEKFEVLNEVLLALKDSVDELRSLDNAMYMHFLVKGYSHKPRPGPVEVGVVKEAAPMYLPPLLFEPTNELDVIVLFAKYHLELGFPYILRLDPSKFPDAIAIDKERNPRSIEFELRSSNFVAHGHDPSKVDYIVCWVDDLPERSELKEKVIELRKRLG